MNLNTEYYEINISILNNIIIFIKIRVYNIYFII